MTQDNTMFGPFTTRQQGPQLPADRAPRTQSKTDPTAASGSFVHTRLHGGIACTAHRIGPVSARFGNVTLIMTDRAAALALVGLFLHFAENVARLGSPVPQRKGRGMQPTGRVAAVIDMAGPQTYRDATVGIGSSGRPEASITVGPVRFTACDRDAARAIASAADDAYAIACELHPELIRMEQWQTKHKNNRVINTHRS